MDVEYACGGDMAIAETDDMKVTPGTAAPEAGDDAKSDADAVASEVPAEIVTAHTSDSRCSHVSITTERDAEPAWAADAPSNFAALLSSVGELDRDAGTLGAARRLTEGDRWGAAFRSMTPGEYASLVAAFDSEFDRPEVAALIAPSVNGGRFTHEYVVAVLDAVADWSRAPLITKLLPLCKDINENSDKIKAEFSEWDIDCTKGVFETAKC